MYWIAQIEPTAESGVRTTIQQRKVDTGTAWQTIARVGARVVSMADRGTQLAVLLDNGDWMLIWEDGSSDGPIPEDGAKLQKFASGDSLWAIAATGLGRKPTTAGATQPASSQPSGTRLLYQFDEGQWKMVASLPAEAGSAREMDLAQTGGHLVLAMLSDNGRILTFTFDQNHLTWNSAGEIDPGNGVTKIQLLNSSGRAAIWAGADKNAGALFFRDDQWSRPVNLNLPTEAVNQSIQDVTLAGQGIRVITGSAGKYLEHRVSADGAYQGKVSLPGSDLGDQPNEFEWMTGLAGIALILVLVQTMRRRSPMSPDMLVEAGLQLAPMFFRLLGGTIDALPVIGTVAGLLINAGPVDPEKLMRTSTYQIWFTSSVVVYIVYCIVCELIWGRTLGKWVFRMKVMTVYGSPPSRRAILIRNVLRVVDVMMPLLLLILVSPLRQRVGDVAAETVVVLDRSITENEK